MTARNAPCAPPPLRTRISSAVVAVAAIHKTAADKIDAARRSLISNPICVADIPRSLKQGDTRFLFYQRLSYERSLVVGQKVLAECPLLALSRHSGLSHTSVLTQNGHRR